MKHERPYVALVLAILGVAILVASMTMIYSYKKEMLGVVLGGVLIQAGVVALVIEGPKVRRTTRRHFEPQ